jgi:hypothetical protein
MNKPNRTIMNERRSTKSEYRGPPTERIVAKPFGRSSSRSSIYSENGRRYRRGRHKADRGFLYLDPLPRQKPSSSSVGEKKQSTNEADVQIIQPTSEPSIFESHDQGADHANKPKSSELSNDQHHQHAGSGVDEIAGPVAQVDAVLDNQELLGNPNNQNRNDINLALAQETACSICGVTLANCAHASKPYQSLEIVERQAQEQRKKIKC